MFECKKCGECCRNLNLSSQYSDLDRGDGVCKYLTGNLCSIYESRPIKCRVDLCYDLHFKNYMTKEEYYTLNYQACNKLFKKTEDK